MKIRNGFVSNSSSSSFVVAFPKDNLTVEEVHGYLFGDLKYMSHPYEFEAVSTEDISITIWKDMMSQKSNNGRLIVEQFKGIAYGGSHEHWHDDNKNEREELLKLIILPEDAYEIRRRNNWNYEEHREEIDRLYQDNTKIAEDNAKILAKAFLRKHKKEINLVNPY